LVKVKKRGAVRTRNVRASRARRRRSGALADVDAGEDETSTGVRRAFGGRRNRRPRGKIGRGAAKFREKRAVEPSNVLIFASRSEIITVDAAFEASETAVPR